MSISDTTLGRNPKHQDIVKSLTIKIAEGQKLGAIEGARRIEFICDQYKHLSPNAAYAWLNPNSIQDEIEDAQTHTRKMEFTRLTRNTFSLLPLIMTWVALFVAMDTYSAYINDPKSDHQLSFLALWLTGFHGRTWFTFTLAAGIDAVLLFIYLISILYEHHLEHNARKIALRYINSLQKEIDQLMKCIMAEGLTLISDQADIDRAVDGVKGVVDSATAALTKIVDETTRSMNKIMTDNFVTFKQLLSATESSVKHYVDDMVTTQKMTLSSVSNTLKNLEHSMNTAMNNAQISLKDYVDITKQEHKQMLLGMEQSNKQTLSNVEQSIGTLIKNAQQDITQTTKTSTNTVVDAHTHIETLFTQTIQPMMTGFHQDMQVLHKELTSYQTRLNDLTDASQQLAGASQGLMTASKALVDNAETYVVVGQDIENQISSLNVTQQEVLSEIHQVASSITTVASSLQLATTNMVSATDGIEKVANQIDAGMTSTIQTMTTNVDKATTTLNSAVKHINSITTILQAMQDRTTSTAEAFTLVEKQLKTTAEQLHQASYELASIELPWFLRRRRSINQGRMKQKGV